MADHKKSYDLKNNARKMFFSQNRTVTENDCEIQLQKYFPFIDSISVWGGEKNTPPIYGSVFCCVKPKGRSLLTVDEKDFIISKLEQLNIITITPRILDPEYIFITLNVSVVYNSIFLNISQPEISSMIKKEIDNYTKENLLKFNRSFQTTSIQNLVNEINPYFMGTTVSLKMYQKKDIKIGVSNYYKIDFNNEIQQKTLETTRFSYIDQFGVERNNCYFFETDEIIEEEEVDSQFSAIAEKKPSKYNVDIRFGSSLTVRKGAGIINYTNGILELEGFKPTKLSNSTTSEMTFVVGTEKYKLNPKKEQIFSIMTEDIEVDSIPNDDELSASSFEKASLFET